VLYGRNLSNETLRLVNQNFAIATSTNIISMLAGSFVLIEPVANRPYAAYHPYPGYSTTAGLSL